MNSCLIYSRLILATDFSYGKGEEGERVTSVLQLPRNVLEMTAYDCCRQYLIKCHYKTHVRAWGLWGIWCLISFQNNKSLFWNKLVNEFCCLINQVISIWPFIFLLYLILYRCIPSPNYFGTQFFFFRQAMDLKQLLVIFCLSNLNKEWLQKYDMRMEAVCKNY